jgi:hypothetical protein
MGFLIEQYDVKYSRIVNCDQILIHQPSKLLPMAPFKSGIAAIQRFDSDAMCKGQLQIGPTQLI